MKWINKIAAFFILAFFWAAPFAVLWFIMKKMGMEPVKYVPLLYCTFLIISLLYKKTWSFKIFDTRKGTIKFLFLFIISIILSVYFNSIIFRSYKLYEYIVADKKRGWEGRAHQPDDTLGFKPLPNARAYHTFSVGDNIPMAFDDNGFRVALADTVNKNRTSTDLLFLGCSFTYGDACYAEETFSYLVAKDTKLSYMNAGVCSYGLAHMLLLAQKLIPKYKPKYLILQYSDWLVARSVNPYASAYFGLLSNPFFAEKGNTYTLQYPTFKTQIYDLDVKQLKGRFRDNFIPFLFEKGLFFYLKEDWFYQKNKFLTLTGQQLKPATDEASVEKYAYGKIMDIAAANGTKVIVLNLGNIEYTNRSHNLFSDRKVMFAEADSSLHDFLQTTASKDYSREFSLWRYNGKDTIQVDVHPNATAHRIIANSIIKKIEQSKKTDSQ